MSQRTIEQLSVLPLLALSINDLHLPHQPPSTCLRPHGAHQSRLDSFRWHFQLPRLPQQLTFSCGFSSCYLPGSLPQFSATFLGEFSPVFVDSCSFFEESFMFMLAADLLLLSGSQGWSGEVDCVLASQLRGLPLNIFDEVAKLRVT